MTDGVMNRDSTFDIAPTYGMPESHDAGAGLGVKIQFKYQGDQ